MKRSIFLGIATALALVVLLAGFAYAATGWDSHPGSGPAVTSQAASGSGQPTSSCDHAAVHQRTATRDNDCPGWTDAHPYGGRQGRGPLARPRPPAHDPPASPAMTPTTTTAILPATMGAASSSPTTIR